MTVQRPTLAAIVAASLLLAVYATRLCPTLALEGDSVEIVTAAALWGVPHAPGYPVLTFAGHVMTKLPFGELPWRVHLTSAFFHAAAVFGVGLLLSRLTRSVAPVVAACAALGLSRAFFVGSLYAEVFPLNDLFFALLLLVAYETSHAEDEDRARRLLLRLAWLTGLAAAHHPMIVFGLPAVIALAGPRLANVVRKSARAGVGLAAAVVVPFFASYALVLLAASRQPAVSWGDVHDLGALVRLVLRLDYGGPFRAALHEAPIDVSQRLAHWVAAVVRDASPYVLALALVGLVAHASGVARGSKRHAIGLALAVLLPGPFFAALNVHFQATEEARVAMAVRFTTMAVVPIAISVGIAVDAARVWIAERLAPRAREAAIGALAALPVLALAPDARALDLSRDRRGLAYAHDLVRSTFDGALVLTSGDLGSPAVEYVCHVERACEERIVLTPGLLSMPWYRAQIARAHPELGVLPASVHEVHRIVDAHAGSRSVYALPGVVVKDPVLLERYAVEPSLLMLRVAPPSEREGARREALTWARLLSTDDGPCEGCRDRRSPLPHPTMRSAVVAEYVAAMRNHAVVARENSDPSLALELERKCLLLVEESSLPSRGPLR